MKKKTIILVVGILLVSIGSTTIFAFSGIESVRFIDSKIYLNENPIPLSDPSALIAKEGANSALAYVPARSLLNYLGFSVDWDADDSSIHLRPKPFTTDILYASIAEFQEQAMPLIGALDSEGVYLYALKPEGAVLVHKNISKAFNWSCYSPRFIMPQIQAADYDHDGQIEIALSLNNGSGAGIDIDELHIVKPSEDNLTDYQFVPDDYFKQLDEMVSYSFSNNNGHVYLHISIENKSTDIDLTSIDASILKVDDCSVTIDQGIVRFFLHEDGKIIIHGGLEIRTQNGEGPIVAELSATVDFSQQGTFKLVNLEVISPPSAYSPLLH